MRIIRAVRNFSFCICMPKHLNICQPWLLLQDAAHRSRLCRLPRLHTRLSLSLSLISSTSCWAQLSCETVTSIYIYIFLINHDTLADRTVWELPSFLFLLIRSDCGNQRQLYCWHSTLLFLETSLDNDYFVEIEIRSIIFR